MREYRNWTAKKKTKRRRMSDDGADDTFDRNEGLNAWCRCERCGNERMAHTKRSHNVGEKPQNNERSECQEVKCMTHRYIIRETKRFFFCLFLFSPFFGFCIFFISRSLKCTKLPRKLLWLLLFGRPRMCEGVLDEWNTWKCKRRQSSAENNERNEKKSVENGADGMRP